VGTLTFTLSSGSNGTATACLDPETTYTPYACGGESASEVSWSVGGVNGGASNICTGGNESFSASGAPSQHPSTAPSSAAPTTTEAPTVTLNPTGFPMLMPTLTPTYAPTIISGITNPGEFNIMASFSDSVLRFENDIKLSSVGLLISDVTNVAIYGTGKMLTSIADDGDTSTSSSSDDFNGYSLKIIRSSVEINTLIIKGGTFGGLYNYDSTVLLSQLSFYSCSQGRALYLHMSSIVMSDILFQDNTGFNDTMAVYKASKVVMKRVQFTSNTRALSVDSTGVKDTPVLLTSVAFAQNSRALSIAGSTVALRYVQFEDNHDALQVSDSGALPSSVILDVVSFARNTGNRYGAIILESDFSSTLTMTSTTFTENQAGVSDYNDETASFDGAALYVSGGAVAASNLVFYDNTPVDTFSSDENGLECVANACAEGTEIVTATGGKCVSCSPCDALRKGFVTMCSSCGAGQFSSRNASLSASCMECGGGNRSFSGANTSCTLKECPVGSFGTLDSSACEICENGYATNTAGLTECTKCLYPEWCPTDGLCSEGHTGVGCVECELNWYMKGNTCSQCPNSAKTGFALVLIVTALLLFVLYKLAGAEDEKEGCDFQGTIKEVDNLAAAAIAKFNVTLSFFQVTTIFFFSFKIDFPVNLLSWLSWIAFPLSFNFVELGRPECSLGIPLGFSQRWSVNTFAPLALMIPFVILAECRKDKSQAIATVVLLGTTTYVPVVGSAMSVWRCEKTDYGNSVIAAAPSITCNNSEDNYSNVMITSIMIASAYLLYVHFTIPQLSQKEGYSKVKRVYEQDFVEGKKWWFHVAVGYKLATLFVAAIVPDAIVQLICMVVLSSSMASMSPIFKPHIVSDENNLKTKYWNGKCSQGFYSIWSEWNMRTKRQWTGIQCMICCVFPAVVLILGLSGQIEFLNMIALLLFLPIFGFLSCSIKCCYEHVFRDGFTPNNVETALHSTEAVLVIVSYLYQAASEKLPHVSKELTDDKPYDEDFYDENGDYISKDERFLEISLNFIYMFGIALSTFEMARTFNPVQYIKNWTTKEMDPVLDLVRLFPGMGEEKTTKSAANEVVVMPPNPLQAINEMELTTLEGANL
jgi:hypothetical protein